LRREGAGFGSRIEASTMDGKENGIAGGRSSSGRSVNVELDVGTVDDLVVVGGHIGLCSSEVYCADEE